MFLRYYKGAYVLEMLRTLMLNTRDPNSDARFINMMQDFVTTFTGKNASTNDFERVVEKHFEEPMDWFFNEWVYGTETPHYDFSYSLSDGQQGKTMLHCSVTQSGVSPAFHMRVPIYIEVNGNQIPIGLMKITGSSTQAADVPLPVRPTSVSLDPYHSILAVEKQ